jgi:hypothetical protein
MNHSFTCGSTLLWSGCLWPLKTYMLKSLSQDDGRRRWAFGSWLGLEQRAFSNGINDLTQGTSKGSLALPCRNTQDAAVLWTGKGTLARHWICGSLDLRLCSLQNWQKLNSIAYKSPSLRYFVRTVDWTDRYLGCFQVLVFMNKDLMNIHVQVFMWPYVFSYFE